MELCTKFHFYPICSHWIFASQSGRVTSCFVLLTLATKYNRVDMYCVLPIWEGATCRKNCFPIFFPKEIPEFHGEQILTEISEKSDRHWDRNLRDFLHKSCPPWLATLLTRDWFNLQRCLVQNHIFWCLRDKTDFWHELQFR